MKFFTQAPIKPEDKDIFIDDVDQLVLQVFPDHEGQHPLFEKFGTRTGGFCDTWERTKDWKNLTETEKWKYVALCSLYWERQYQYWLDCKEYKDFLKFKGDKNGL